MVDLADTEPLTLVGRLAGARSAGMALGAALPTLRRFDPAVAIITERGGFDALKEEWLSLEATSGGAAVFQSFAWCRAVFDHHLQHRHAFRPVILTLREAGRLVALLPLQIVDTGLSRIATGFGEPYQQYSDLLLADGAPADAARRLFEAACRLPRCDGLNLLKVRDGSTLDALVATTAAIRSNEDATPFVDLASHESFDAYLATINAKTRKNMRNLKNRLARAGTLEHRVLTDPADIAALVKRTHSGRERWLAENGLTSRAFRDASFGDFTARLAENDDLPIMAMSLTLDGRSLADQWGFVHGGRYYAYVATWTPEFEEASPGKLHLEQVIRACHERGLSVADFLMPAARYKFTWTSDAVTVADYALPLSFRARLQLSLWSGHLRPWLKRLTLRLPVGLRSRIARLLLRR